MAPQIFNLTDSFSPSAESHANGQYAPATDAKFLFTVVKDFLDLYSSPDNQHINPTNERLEAAMRTDMKARKICSPKLEKHLHPAASLVE
ncbi:hypothetical protein H0H92_008248, partial [Tricholoma furcatifolium]